MTSTDALRTHANTPAGAPRDGGGAPRRADPVDASGAGRADGRGRIPHGPAFWLIAATIASFLAASAAPSPLYAIYQERWGFSPSTLTEVFAVYAIALLGALLTVGALSDHLGRRPVIAGAIVGELIALGLFLVAGDVVVLGLARVVQGVATGAALASLSAALVDFQPADQPLRAGSVSSVVPGIGLSAGALGTGLLVVSFPAPTELVFALLAGLFVVLFAAVLRLPETSPLRPGAAASLRPRARVPRELRAEVLAITPILLASWSLGGIFLSLGPSVATGVFDQHSRLTGGIVIALLGATGGVTAFFMRHVTPRDAVRPGALGLLAGMLVALAGVLSGVTAIAAAGTVVAGMGFGAAGIAGFGTLAAIAPPADRGEVLAVGFVISYLAFSLPAVAGGFAAQAFGLHATAVAIGVLVAGLSAAALLATHPRLRRTPEPVPVVTCA